MQIYSPRTIKLPSPQTVVIYIYLLGIFTACAIIIIILLLLAWLCQELLLALIEIGHIISTINPLVIVGFFVVVTLIWYAEREARYERK